MADFGTFATRSLAPTITRPGVGTFGGTTFTEFALGTFTVRSLGSSGDTTTIEVEVVVPAPPSANGAGDWPMRFFAGELSPDVGGIPPPLKMCPDDSVLYVVYYEIINRSGSSRTVKLFLPTDDPDVPYQQVNQSLAAGVSLVAPSGFKYMLGEGEEILGSASASGVFCSVQGIEEVR